MFDSLDLFYFGRALCVARAELLTLRAHTYHINHVNNNKLTHKTAINIIVKQQTKQKPYHINDAEQIVDESNTEKHIDGNVAAHAVVIADSTCTMPVSKGFPYIVRDSFL